MPTCLYCGKDTKNKKFCSKSCSASHNNKGVRRHGKKPNLVCPSCGNTKDNRAKTCMSCRTKEENKIFIGKSCEYKHCNNPLVGRQKRFCSRVCNSADRVMKFRKRRKRKAVEYLGGGCERCGYKKCDRALTFHHKNPNGKSFSISQGYTLPWKIFKKELDKCSLLCANCHMELEESLI